MSINHLKKWLAGSLLLVSTSGAADWYEATGHADIKNGNTAQARQNAIDEALKQAALFAGVSVSNIQSMSNGIMQSEQFILSSHSDIKEVQVLSETYSNNQIFITLRADITPSKAQCQLNHFKKTVLLADIQLAAREDAIHGQLFGLPKDVKAQLERHIRDISPAVSGHVYPHIVMQEQLTEPLISRLFQQGSQYILTASINDLSTGPKNHRFWQKAVKERFFSIGISLFDLFEQQVVFRQEYRTSAPWPYKENTPDSHSQAFWNMEYGTKIDTVLNAAATDIQQQLQCAPLISTIKQVRQNQIMLNAGKQQGLQEGSALELIQLQYHPGIGLKRLIASPVKLVVTEINQTTAWAKPVQQTLISHIQQGDIVIIR